jgi:hypothetical protein
MSIVASLIDPLLSDLQPEQLLAIHAFVQHVVNRTDQFKNTYNNLENFLKPNYSSIYGNMQDWLKEMDAYAYKSENGLSPPRNQEAHRRSISL